VTYFLLGSPQLKTNKIMKIISKQLTDEPIKRAEQDVLGRGDFANSVADLILSAPKAQSSQVIGLFGKWGEGKTSLKNMVIEAHKAQCELKPLVVEFNPWTYTSQERLPFLFFSEIAHKFGKETNDEQAQKLEKQFKQFGQILEIASLVPQLTFFTMWFKPILNFFGNQYANQTKDLGAVRQQIHDLMLKESRRLIVIIDDLDRISAEEVRRMIQLVKANGDFPNITYLLLCDRSYAGRALSTVVDGCTDEDGDKYLEKIVTFGLDLPRIRQVNLQDYLVELLINVLGRHNITNDEFDPKLELPPTVLQLIHNIRDVKRLIAGFEFQLAMHRKKSGDIASIHVDDLIALEACRIFEPKFYHAIYKHKDVLMCEAETITPENDRKLKVEWVKTNLISFISENHPNLGKEFLSAHLGWRYGEYSYEIKDYMRCVTDKAKLQFRLALPECFERYFNLYSNPAEFTKADLEQFKDSLKSTSSALNVLRSIFEDGRLRDFLSTIELYFEESDPVRQENYISALTLAAEFATDNSPDMHIMEGEKFGFTLTTHLHRCVRFFLERAIFNNERSKLLTRVFRRETETIVMPVSILSSEHGSRERNAGIKKLLTDDDYHGLKELCCQRIEDLQKQEKLIGHVDEREIRQMWITIGNSDTIKKLLEKDFLSYPAVTHALLPLTGYSSSTDGTFYTINLSGLEKYTDPTQVLKLLKSQPELPTGEKGIQDCLEFSINAKNNHEPYDHETQIKSVYERNSLKKKL
jgi:hypothetical protein